MPMAEKYNIMTLRRFSALPYALAALLCAGLLSLAPAAARADTLEEANRLMKQGQLGPALEKTDQVLAAKPKDAQARFMKGLILTEMNRHNEAIAVFTKLTEDYPELPEPYNNLAVLYAQQRQFEKAKNALEMAIRTHPSYATAHENLGDIYARMASQAYDKALQIDSSNASAQSKLAMIRDLMSVAARPTALASRSTSGKVQTPPTPVAKAEVAPVAKSEPAPVAKSEPAEPKPAPAVETKPAAAGKQDVEKTIRDWAAAWSRKDVKAYLAAYDRDFQTPGGEARNAWEAERTRRISKTEPIQVGVENIQVSVEGDRATAKFRQHYRSGKLKTSATKAMVMVRRDGRWLIQQERVAN
ncbi:MAG: tetratricopeptide repeat protein [Rhodocyclales bacterium]|nr:tetratricopeptide repeat protein [Rhodocyclales bacterium]